MKSEEEMLCSTNKCTFARGMVGDGGGRGGGRGREEKGNPNIFVQSCGQSHHSL